MRRLLFALIACSPAADQKPVIPIANAAPTTTPASDVDAIARLELQRYVDGAPLPDAGLLSATRPTVVDKDVATMTVDEPPRPLVLTSAALPNPNAFVLKTRAELQAEADATNKTVAFIDLWIRIERDRADVGFGVDILLPSKSKEFKLCCCSAVDEFERKAGAWTFVGRGMTSCS